MFRERAIPLSVVVLFIGLFVMLVLGLIFLNLESTAWAGVLAGSIAAVVVGSAAGLLFWVVRRLEIGEARLIAIVESAADGIITTDEDGYIETVNTSTVAMFGYRPGEVIGNRITVLLTSLYRDEDIEGDLELFLKANHMEASGRAYEVVGLRRDGTRFPMDLSVTRARLGERNVYTAMVRDVSERAKARQALQQAHDQLESRVRERTAELQEANTRLEAEIAERKRTQAEREKLIEELQKALAQIKTLSGLLPICASCKKIRDDQGYWNQIEVYLHEHSEVEFSHGICPECAAKLYPDLKI